MRILFINQHAFLPQLLGGIEQTTHELARHLEELGHESAVLCTLARHDAVWFRNRLQSKLARRAFPADRYQGTLVYRGYDPRRGLDEVLPEFAPGAVVINGGTRESFEIATDICRRGIPAAYYFHEMTTVRPLRNLDALGNLALVSNSRYTASVIADLFGRASVVIPPLIDADAYRTVSSRRVVTMVNPRRDKGGELALELARACPDIPFVFVEAWTPDECVLRLRRAARALANVRWLRPTVGIRDLYARTRILLAPSTREETWGRVASEAHISGIPVLATTSAALPESVGPGGMLLAPEAPLTEWVSALRAMWDDPALYAALSARALEYSRRPEIQPRLQAERLLQVLRAACDSAGSGHG